MGYKPSELIPLNKSFNKSVMDGLWDSGPRAQRCKRFPAPWYESEIHAHWWSFMAFCLFGCLQAFAIFWLAWSFFSVCFCCPLSKIDITTDLLARFLWAWYVFSLLPLYSHLSNNEKMVGCVCEACFSFGYKHVFSRVEKHGVCRARISWLFIQILENYL